MKPICNPCLYLHWLSLWHEQLDMLCRLKLDFRSTSDYGVGHLMEAVLLLFLFWLDWKAFYKLIWFPLKETAFTFFLCNHLFHRERSKHFVLSQTAKLSPNEWILYNFLDFITIMCFRWLLPWFWSRLPRRFSVPKFLFVLLLVDFIGFIFKIF